MSTTPSVRLSIPSSVSVRPPSSNASKTRRTRVRRYTTIRERRSCWQTDTIDNGVATRTGICYPIRSTIAVPTTRLHSIDWRVDTVGVGVRSDAVGVSGWGRVRAPRTRSSRRLERRARRTIIVSHHPNCDIGREDPRSRRSLSDQITRRDSANRISPDVPLAVRSGSRYVRLQCRPWRPGQPVSAPGVSTRENDPSEVAAEAACTAEHGYRLQPKRYLCDGRSKGDS